MDKDKSNFLEISVINEIIQKIEQIEAKCKGCVGEDIVNSRIKQAAYAKILCNVYGKDSTYVIKAFTQLGIAYLDINYFEQAQEHLFNAFKLNETLSDELNSNMKEYQIKILINLSKCYLENNKIPAALAISERSLRMNQTLLGQDHVSNADIYYVLAKVHTKMKKFSTAIENLQCMFRLYEKLYGFDSEKTAKICMELGQIYELSNDLPNAIDYYYDSYKIWKKIIQDSNYEVLFSISIKLAELYEKSGDNMSALQILISTEEECNNSLGSSVKKRINYQKLRVKYAQGTNDLNKYLDELLGLEKILIETNENNKTLAKTCISIALTYNELQNRNKCLEYLDKAEKIFVFYGDSQLAKDIQQKKQILMQEEQNIHQNSQ